MAILQLLPIEGLQNYSGALGTFFPVICVVLVSMIKDLVEDSGRHKQDKYENDMFITAMNRGDSEWSEVMAKNLQVGCLVKIPQNMIFPADILIVTSSLPKGICYVETKNLDGETNLKHK